MVRVIRLGAPNLATSRAEKFSSVRSKIAARRSSERHRRAGPTRPAIWADDDGDAQHHGADAQDQVDVAVGDAVVDDPGVQRG